MKMCARLQAWMHLPDPLDTFLDSGYTSPTPWGLIVEKFSHNPAFPTGGCMGNAPSNLNVFQLINAEILEKNFHFAFLYSSKIYVYFFLYCAKWPVNVRNFQHNFTLKLFAPFILPSKGGWNLNPDTPKRHLQYAKMNMSKISDYPIPK